MDSYNISNDQPITLKIAVQTEAIPISYVFLYHNVEDEKAYAFLPPFDPSLDTDWKLLDNGQPVQEKIIRITTFLRFFNDFKDQETFNLAIKQIEDTYEVLIDGGVGDLFQVPFEIESYYETKTCILQSELKLK